MSHGQHQGGAWCAFRHAGHPLPLTPRQACLHGSGVPRDSPPEGHSPRDFASIAPGVSQWLSQEFSILFDFISHGQHPEVAADTSSKAWYWAAQVSTCLQQHDVHVLIANREPVPVGAFQLQQAFAHQRQAHMQS